MHMNVPTEILDRIFSLLEEQVRKFDSERDWPDWDDWNRMTSSTPQTSLHPLLFVCKEWRDVAHRRLYRSVGLRGCPIYGRDFDFCRTVKENHHLAPLVQELRLRAFNTPLEGSLRLVEILSYCKNAVSVSILVSQWSKAFSFELKHALKRMDLVELFVSCCPDDKNPQKFHEPSDVTLYMQHWPRLQKLSVDGVFHDFDNAKILPNPSILKGRCRALRDINVRPDYLSTHQLLALSEMAPDVESFSACIDADATDALQTCLSTWSSTLTNLSLDVGTSNVVLALPSLRGLRLLSASSRTVPPSALLDLENLRILIYFIAVEDLEKLADILTEKERPMLPSLRELDLVRDRNVWNESTDEDRSIVPADAIRDACNYRDMCLDEDLALPPMSDDSESDFSD